MSNAKFIEVQHVAQSFKTAKGVFQALQSINLSIAQGVEVALARVEHHLGALDVDELLHGRLSRHS